MERARTISQWGNAIGAVPLAWSLPLAFGVLSLTTPLALLVARDLDPSSAAMMVLVPLAPAVLVLFGRWLGGSLDRLRLLARTDPLTGLYNRRHFEHLLQEELGRAGRMGRTTSVLCLDVDRLKSINDGFGHGAGDRALLTVGGLLGSPVRVTDVVARLGGDEFALLLCDASGARASAIALRILRDVRGSDPGPGVLAVSIGIVEIAKGSTSAPADVMAAADAALYRAKAAGGGRAALTRLEATTAKGSRAAIDRQTLFVEDVVDGAVAP